LNGDEKDYDDLDFYIPNENWYWQRMNKNIGALGALNYVFEKHPNEPFYGFIADDEFVQTDNWDTKLIEAAGGWGIACGDEGRDTGGRAQPFPCIGGKLARAVGYLALPECDHWYGLDNVWGDIGAKLGNITFLADVKIEHRHPYLGAAEKDECYALGESRKDLDYQFYANWLRHHLKGAVERVRKAKEADSVS
jgi:hypothetical protein